MRFGSTTYFDGAWVFAILQLIASSMESAQLLGSLMLW
jgi:hypothetical protein